MLFCIYAKSTGEIISIYTSANEEEVKLQLTESQTYLILADSIDAEQSYIDIVEQIVITKPIKPDNYSIFNYTTKLWEYPIDFLSKAQTDAKGLVNSYSSLVILDKYPIYRQINYNREPDSPSTIEMNLWIDGVRAESNITTSSIDSATDLAAIEGIVEGFKAYLESL